MRCNEHVYFPYQQKRTPKEGCGNFLGHEIYKKIVSSVKAGIGMEGESCAEKMHILDVSIVAFLCPQNAPKSLALPQTPLGS